MSEEDKKNKIQELEDRLMALEEAQVEDESIDEEFEEVDYVEANDYENDKDEFDDRLQKAEEKLDEVLDLLEIEKDD
tara:strand:+ start:827 stop:1057 length:231 start_codon:yes stop_codon:yes gene_type:complete